MKKTMRMLALILAMLSMLSVAAFAAEVDNGKATITPMANTEVTLDSTNSEKILVTYTNAAVKKDSYYLILMLAGDGTTIDKNTILYIDQVTAVENGKLSFSVYPSTFKDGVIMVVAEGVTPDTGLAGIKAAIIDVKYIMGDVNGDGVINSKDAVIFNQHLAGIEMMDSSVLDAADINKDNAINSKDIVAMNQFLAGLVDYLG